MDTNRHESCAGVVTLDHVDGTVTIAPCSDGKCEVGVVMRDPVAFVSTSRCKTAYTPDLIELILKIKGPAYLCDEIRRDEDSTYVEKRLREDLSLCFDVDELNGKRILDFGCGSGASTMVLHRMFPDSEILGIELDPEFLQIARARTAFYGVDGVTFLQSPSGTELPDGLSEFDVVMFSAVLEHLLPEERQPVLVQAWSLVCDSGIMFISQTPNRWFPVEDHTTGLPLLNYIADPLALALARMLSSRIKPSTSWSELLRMGIRGGTLKEVLKTLGLDADVLVPPRDSSIRDQSDLWLVRSSPRWRGAKRSLAGCFRFIERATGICPVPAYIVMALRKNRRGGDI